MITLKPIIPKQQFNPADMDRALNDAVAKTLKVGAGYFKRTTSSWKTSVKFEVDGPENGAGAVGTNNDIYGYVSRGTRPHLIAPKNASVLSWEGGKYAAKTRTGVLGSRGGGLRPTGGVGQAVFARVVHHPGTKARAFEEIVAKRLQPVLEREVTAAILRTVK
jgi:hypothetical protein